MLKTSTIAAAITTGCLLVGAAPALAATGHSSTVNGGAAGTSSANAYTGVLNAGDVSGSNAVGATPLGTITCTNATGAGQVTGDGGGTFPIGGTGPVGYLSTIGLTTPTNPNGYCSTTIGSLGNPYADAVAVDNNAGAGLWDVQGDWAGGAPTLSFPAAKVQVKLRNKTAPSYTVLATCNYTGALTGAVNNAAHTLGVTGLLSGGVSPCPATINYSASYNLYTTSITSYVYLTA